MAISVCVWALDMFVDRTLVYVNKNESCEEV